VTSAIHWHQVPEGTADESPETCVLAPGTDGLVIAPGRAGADVAEILMAGGARPHGTGYADALRLGADTWAEMMLTAFRQVDLAGPDGAVERATPAARRYLDRIRVLAEPAGLQRTRILDGAGPGGSLLVPATAGARFVPVSTALPGKPASTRHSHLLFRSPDRDDNDILLVYSAAIGGFESIRPASSPEGVLLLAAFRDWLADAPSPVEEGDARLPAPRRRRPRTAWLERRMAAVVGEYVPVIESGDALYRDGVVSGMEGRMLRSVASVLYDIPPGKGHRCVVLDASLSGAAFREQAAAVIGTLRGDPSAGPRLAQAVFTPATADPEPLEYWPDED